MLIAAAGVLPASRSLPGGPRPGAAGRGAQWQGAHQCGHGQHSAPSLLAEGPGAAAGEGWLSSQCAVCHRCQAIPRTQWSGCARDAALRWLAIQGNGLCESGQEVHLSIADLAAELMFLCPGLSFCAGPQVVSEAYKTHGKVSSDGSGVPVSLRGHGMQKTLTPHVYGLGEFYLPCNWLSQDLCAQVDSAETKPAHLAGFHHWAGSWKIVQVS